MSPSVQLPTPAMLGWWWGLWLSAGVVGMVGGSLQSSAMTLEAYRTGVWPVLLSHLVIIVAGVLMIWIIRGIDDRQEEKFRRAADQTATAPRAVLEM